MASFYGSVRDVQSTSAKLHIEFESDSSGFTGKRYVRLTVEDEYGDLIYDEKQYTGTNSSDGSVTTWNITISNLEPNTTYDWYAYLGYKGTGDDSISWLDSVDDDGSFTTIQDRIIPTCAVHAVTHNSVTFYVEGVAEAYDDWHYYGAFVYDEDGNQVAGPEWTEHDDDFFIEVDGLTPRSSYTASIWVSERPDGEAPNQRIVLLEFTTDPPYSVDSTYNSVTVSVPGGAELSVDFPYFNISIYDSDWNEVNSTGWIWYNNDITVTFSNLDSNTEYVVEVVVATSSSGLNSYSLGEEEISTLKPPMPSFSIVSITEQSVRIQITNVAAAFDYWHYYKTSVSDTKGNVVTETKWSSASTNFEVELSGLTANTQYSITVWVAATSSGGDPCAKINTRSFTTSALSKWVWTASNGLATKTQTQTAHKILLGELPVDAGFHHNVWNDFVNKVFAMRKLFGDGTWDCVGGDYLSYDDCMVDVGDTLSADIYNATKLQIGQVVGLWEDVETGDLLCGWHIVNLAEKLNDAITHLS